MIFRRSNEPTPVLRKNAAQQKNSFDARREPSLSARSIPSGTAVPNMNHQLQQPPISPITVAQNRRTQPAANPASAYNGKDQLRKLTVGRDISLNGEIGTCDHLVVEGTVCATIKDGKILEITDTGTFSGTVDIEQADIAGTFDGELIVRGKLIIRPTARVTGMIVYGRLQVDTGATINAQLNLLQEQPPIQQPAPQETIATQVQMPQATYAQDNEHHRAFSLASFNDEPGFLRANAN